MPSGSETTETEPSDVQTYRIWFTQGSLPSEAAIGREYLFPVWREGPTTEAVGAEALRLLLDGPTAAEREPGVDASSQIPSGTRLLGLDIDGGTATVDLTSEYESGGGSASMFARLAQVVYTLTEFPTVQRVSFMLDGEPVDVFSGEGIVLEEPVGRKEYAELMPPILVESPAIGDTVSSPVEVTRHARTSSRRTSPRASSTRTGRSSSAASRPRRAEPAAAARSRSSFRTRWPSSSPARSSSRTTTRTATASRASRCGSRSRSRRPRGPKPGSGDCHDCCAAVP